MDRQAFRAFKTFFRYSPDGNARVGNCAVCHTPVEFTDFKKHVVAEGGTAKPTPSLRNLDLEESEIEKAIMQKIMAADLKQSGNADEISDRYSKMTITGEDIPGLVKFLNQLKDIDDTGFRKLILDATLLDTSEAIE